MLEIISRIAEKLQADGFSDGTRVAVCSESQIEYYLLTLACWKTGAVVVPVSTRYPDQILAAIIANLHCAALFVSHTHKRNAPNCRRYILETYVSCRQDQIAPLTFEQLDLDLAADASILLTSGSSSLPKGVLHTIGNHYYNALGAIENISFERDDRWLVSLPMYHISSFSLIMRSLINGGTLIFPGRNESLLETVINKKITHLSLVPTQLKKMIQIPQSKEILRHCKSILLGGAAFSPTLIKQALDRKIPLSTTYGLTESASQVATMVSADLKRKPDASGRILPYRELKIAKDGEILLKGAILFKGYVFEDMLESPIDTEGYFHTGDIGVLDGEGFLSVIGRKDRMFISGGENIFPEQIEKALLTIDSVEQAYVVAVPDTVMGQRPVAFIETASQHPFPNTKTVNVHLERYIERFKIPIAFLPWPSTKTKTLKPDGRLFEKIALETISEENRS
jgi:O-succinylbenzoic acid--CoA ligase